MANGGSEHGDHGQLPDAEKLKQLAIYVASRSQEDRKFGSTKFNKILFCADYMHYLKTGRSITGFAYIKKQFGPCPEDFDVIQNEMTQAGQFAIQEIFHFGLTQKRPIALVVPDLSNFTGEEVATIEEALDSLLHLNGKEASDWSHGFVGWQLASDFEKIPYSIARLGFDGKPNDYHYEMARQVAKEVATRLGLTG